MKLVALKIPSLSHQHSLLRAIHTHTLNQRVASLLAHDTTYVGL